MNTPPQGSSPNVKPESQKEGGSTTNPPTPGDKDGKQADPAQQVPQFEPVKEGNEERKAANDG